MRGELHVQWNMGPIFNSWYSTVPEHEGMKLLFTQNNYVDKFLTAGVYVACTCRP